MVRSHRLRTRSPPSISWKSCFLLIMQTLASMRRVWQIFQNKSNDLETAFRSDCHVSQPPCHPDMQTVDIRVYTWLHKCQLANTLLCFSAHTPAHTHAYAQGMYGSSKYESVLFLWLVDRPFSLQHLVIRSTRLSNCHLSLISHSFVHLFHKHDAPTRYQVLCQVLETQLSQSRQSIFSSGTYSLGRDRLNNCTANHKSHCDRCHDEGI